VSFLHTYLHHFSKLRRDAKNVGAPHKPVLLLAVLVLVRKEELYPNRIENILEQFLEFRLN
jgi:hypothetical protein